MTRKMIFIERVVLTCGVVMKNGGVRMSVPSTTVRGGMYYLNLVNKNRENCRFSLETKNGDTAYKIIKNNSTLIECYKKCFITKEEFCKQFSLPDIKKKEKKYTVSKPRLYEEYHCEKCSNDILVKMGLCSGNFIIQKDNLNRGSVPCRCSGHYRYTKDQLTFLEHSL